MKTKAEVIEILSEMLDKCPKAIQKETYCFVLDSEYEKIIPKYFGINEIKFAKKLGDNFYFMSKSDFNGW